MAKKSIGSLSYTGVRAPSPPNFLRNKRDPTIKNNRNYNIGDIWLATSTQKIFMLLDKNNREANWVELYPASLNAAEQFPADIGTAVADNNTINVNGGNNINTTGAGNTITINLDDSISLIGTLTIPALASGIGTVDGAGLIGSSKGGNGYVLIGSDAGDPLWARITSADNSIVFDYGDNTLGMRAVGGGGGGGITQYDSDLGSALPVLGIINILGGTNVNTDAATDTLYVNLDDNVTLTGTLTISSFGHGVVQSDNTGLFSSSSGTDGQVLIAATGAAAVFANIVAGDATINIVNGANSIQITANCGGGGGTVTGLSADDLNTATPTLNIINIAGGDNINTSAAGNTLTVNLDKSILQPITNAAGTEGLYSLGGHDFMHSYGGQNTFLGEGAGNRTLTTADYNVGVGYLSLMDLTTGEYNTGIGSGALSSVTTSDSNTAIGFGSAAALISGSDGNVAIGQESLSEPTIGAINNVAIGYKSLESSIGTAPTYNVTVGYKSGNLLEGSYNTIIGPSSAVNLTTGTNNTIIGYTSGSNYTGAESSNILIANNGVLGESNKLKIGIQGTHDECYIAGIYGTAVSEKMVFVDATGKLGTSVPGADGALLIGASTGSVAWGNITSTGGSIDVQEGAGTINLEVLSSPGTTSFLGVQAANVANVTGEGTSYFLGYSSALTEIFDTGADYDPGGGSTYAKYTAPSNGIYFFDTSILLTNLVITGTYQTKVTIGSSGGDDAKCYNVMLNENATTQSIHFSGLLKMNSADYVIISIMIDMVGSGKTIGVGMTDTFFSGHRISGV